MRLGMFEGQMEALQKRVDEIRQEERKRGSRRLLLTAIPASVLALGSGLLLGRATTSKEERSEEAAELAPELEWARKLAMAPDEELLAKQAELVHAASDADPRDHWVWFGIARLVHAAVHHHPRAQRSLPTALVMLSTRSNVPAHVRKWCEAIPHGGR